MSFPFYKQLDSMDCGPTCLRMIAKHYGKVINIQKLRDKSGTNKEGVSLLGLSEASESIGLRTLSVKTTLNKLMLDAPLPCIVHWQQNHFVVVYRITKSKVYIADPSKDLLVFSHEEFLSGWQHHSTYLLFKAETSNSSEIEETQISRSATGHGIVLLLETTPHFYENVDDIELKVGFKKLLKYLYLQRNLLNQLLISLITGTAFQLVLPFLTQSVVDIGIFTHNLSFVSILLIAQLILMVSRVIIEFIRSWILLYISNRLNLSILSDFFIKLFRLPLPFFDTKNFGDIMQRINDHHNIQQFLTGSSVNILFSIFNLFVFGFVLVFYNLNIFIIFILGSILYMFWIFIFLHQRRKLNFKQFALSAQNQSNVVQLIQGMKEIKLANSETFKRWDWERLQARSYQLSMKSLSLGQWQQAGGVLINESKNIFITFLAAQAVINGQMSLGALVAMQYIIGQLNSPIQELIHFVQIFQDAQISLERINEIHQSPDEEPENQPKVDKLPQNKSISFKNVYFQYPGTSEPVLKDISFKIPEGKTTAIVGMSGSGKTTLLKLLLKIYQPTQGEIRIGEIPLHYISYKIWRAACGTVMQDGFILSDTIAGNISLGDEKIDFQKLTHSINTANIQDFIENLPLGYNTKIGAEGNGLSQGQKQRILIARAIYKNPEYFFLDEATNSLDTNNESIIMQNMELFVKEKTVIIVAHRLSTVKNTDNIIVLDKGKIVEQGSHYELLYQEGKYYELVKNQINLGI